MFTGGRALAASVLAPSRAHQHTVCTLNAAAHVSSPTHPRAAELQRLVASGSARSAPQRVRLVWRAQHGSQSGCFATRWRSWVTTTCAYVRLAIAGPVVPLRAACRQTDSAAMAREQHHSFAIGANSTCAQCTRIGLCDFVSRGLGLQVDCSTPTRCSTRYCMRLGTIRRCAMRCSQPCLPSELTTIGYNECCARVRPQVCVADS